MTVAKEGKASQDPSARSRSQARIVVAASDAVKTLPNVKDEKAKIYLETAIPSARKTHLSIQADSSKADNTERKSRQRRGVGYEDVEEMASQPIVQGTASSLPIIFTKDAE